MIGRGADEWKTDYDIWRWVEGQDEPFAGLVTVNRKWCGKTFFSGEGGANALNVVYEDLEKGGYLEIWGE